MRVCEFINLCRAVPASELTMQQLSHWAGQYKDVHAGGSRQIELREDEFEDIVVLEVSGHDTDPDDNWKGSGKVSDAISATYAFESVWLVAVERIDCLRKR